MEYLDPCMHAHQDIRHDIVSIKTESNYYSLCIELTSVIGNEGHVSRLSLTLPV